MKSVMFKVKAAGVGVLLAAGMAGYSLASSVSAQASTSANFTNGGEPGACLDVNSNGYPYDGDPIQLYSCNTHPEQEWTLTGSGQVKNPGSGLCLDANSNGYPNDGDPIQLYSCNTHPEQEWILGSLKWPGTSGPGEASKYFGYPYPDPPACTDGGACVLDKWKFDQGQCTSWVAYRLNELNGISFTETYRGQSWGNASTWGTAAKNLKIAVNGTPAVGSIAWYASGIGHVAYVEQVNSPTSVVISEMNYDGDNGFRVRTITTSSGWPTDFIHIADR